MPQGAIEIGKYLYLFPSESNRVDCLISAHGGFYKENRDFEVGGCTLYFYGEHRKTLSDPGLSLMYKAAKSLVVNSYGTKGADGTRCVDYLLSKYQNSEKEGILHSAHNQGDETYTTIRNAISAEEQRFATLIERAASAKNAGARAFSAQQAADTCPMNILTIRNRANKADIKLSYAIAQLKRALPTLARFHCSFCRNLIGDKNPQQSVLQSRRLPPK